MALHLSKSQYCHAVQCPKMLWLMKNRPEAFDESVMNMAVLQTGNEVGDLAMGLFGEFTEVPFCKEDLASMIRETERLLDEGVTNIAEASFSYNGMFCSVDVLVNLGNKQVEMYEVKSSTSVHEIYLHDTAFQYYVLSKLGYEIKKICVVHINSNYIRHGELDLQEFFTVVDVTSEAQARFREVESRIAFLSEYMEQTEEPVYRISPHCSSPYGCGYWEHCTKDLPKPNVFQLAGMQQLTKFKNFDAGLIGFEELLLNEKAARLNPNQKLQIMHELQELPDQIRRDSIEKVLQKITYPLYFLDFESVQEAVPLYENTKPFQQIVFQYSLHWMEEKDGELNHREFLSYPGRDPRRELAERLVEDIPMDVCVLTYNMAFEKTRIKELAKLFPDLSGHLMNIHDHIQDLMIPFKNKDYYNRAMQGSFSIKYVLPALFPDDPELNYHNLEGVQNGGEASAAFRLMAKMDREELETYRGYLLKYCGLDTLALVKILQKLYECVQ